MTNIKTNSIGKDVIKLTTSKIITMIISMVSAMLLSRFRTLEEYGTYSQILMIVNLVTSLLMLGLPNSINYFLASAETAGERQRFLSVYYTLSTILSIIIGLCLVLATPLIVEYFNNDMFENFMYFLAIYPWTKIIMSSVENVLIVYKRSSIIMIYRISNSISLLLIILTVQIFHLGFNIYMILFVLVESIFAIIVYVIIRNISGGFRISMDISLIREILTFSIPIGLASVVGTLNIELDKLMIGRFLNIEQLAIYTNASREMPVTIIASSLTAILLPSLVRMLKNNRKQAAIDLWGNAIQISYIIICFLAAGFFVFAPDVMTLLYSKKYLSGVSIFRVYNLALLLRFTYFGMILNAKGKTKLILYTSIISLGLNVILNYVLFNSIGIIGPAIATLLSQFVINIIQLIISTKIINISIFKIFPWKKLLYVTIVNIILGLLFYYIKIIIPMEIEVGEVLESILLGMIWGIIYMFIFRKEVKEKWLLLNKED